MFQSSPGPKARCYRPFFAAGAPVSQFQSSPGPKARCYIAQPYKEFITFPVSILTGPEGPVLPEGTGPKMHGMDVVSILTGPEGPVLRGVAVVRDHAVVVSILTGPEGPVLPAGSRS